MNRGKRSRSPAVWAVALVLGAPALVQAQTQLFPLAPIQRERPPCPMEDPIYGLYRHQYYGYFPTCWRPFPAGWGCPSPEAPNQAQAFRDLPRDKPRELPPMPADMEEFGPLPGEEPGVPRGRNPLPPLPGGERSPFDIDTPPNAPDMRGGPPPREELGIPPEARRDAPAQGVPEPVGAGNAATAPLMTLPDPVEAPTTGLPPATESGTETLTEVVPTPTGPITLPDGAMVPPPVVNMPGPVPMNPNTRPGMDPSSPAGVLAPPSVAPIAMPAQAPQRRGPLSTLFSGLSAKLRR